MAMVVMEGCTVGLTIMTKTVMARGMSPYVFVVYSNALSSLILLVSFFIFHRSVPPPPPPPPPPSLSLSILAS
ncbi:hypothetical protein BVC80_1431g29 [Macleaya cordata]|uniref:WAT1-related protein n=1 Tax=Macleaya cordata TaxID=56857 RepID=A0A200PZS3_MACCD|nr:hypothetical protein BVC80_1431g29 [Macleaya cordata]